MGLLWTIMVVIPEQLKRKKKLSAWQWVLGLTINFVFWWACFGYATYKIIWGDRKCCQKKEEDR